MTDFSRMFESKSLPDNPVSKGNGLSVVDIASWRQDLSDKVREHVDLIEKLVVYDIDPIAGAEERIKSVVAKVIKHVNDSKPGFLSRLFKSEIPVDFGQVVRNEIALIDNDLKNIAKLDPFKVREARQVVNQAEYLSEQLVKASRDLEAHLTNCGDDLQVEAINRRCSTLFHQQQLVASGYKQVCQLANDLQTRPQQAQDLLNTVTAACRLLCLDVLSGKKSPDDLRRFL
jgi:hypothetical protein